MIKKKIIMYLRKSRTDNQFESVSEVLSRHEQMLQDYCKRVFNQPIPNEDIYREVVSGETINDKYGETLTGAQAVCAVYRINGDAPGMWDLNRNFEQTKQRVDAAGANLFATSNISLSNISISTPSILALSFIYYFVLYLIPLGITFLKIFPLRFPLALLKTPQAILPLR